MNDTNNTQLLNQAASQFQTGNFTQAQNLLSQVLLSDKDCADAWLLMAKINLNNGNKKDAVQAYNEVLRLNPSSEEAVINLINYHGVKEEFKECETLLRNAIESNPGYARYQYMLGNLLLQMGYHAEAVKYQELALKNAPGNLQVIIALAETHGKHGNLDAALEVLRPLLEADPPNFQAVIVFANICSALNMIEDCQILINKLSKTSLNQEQTKQLQEINNMLLKNAI